jgi:DNA-binding transcriptional regulator YiaG
MTDEMKNTNVLVRIPNLDGDGIAETLTIQVPVAIDPHTGEELLTERAIEIIDNTKARYMGLLLASEIKRMRERLGLTQKVISELVQSGEKSWTRWETGKARPSRMVNVLLRLIYEGKVFVSDLIVQRKPGIDWRKNCHPQFSRSMVVTQVKVSAEQVQLCSAVTGLSPPEYGWAFFQSKFFPIAAVNK